MSTTKSILISYKKSGDEGYIKTVMKNSYRVRQKSNEIYPENPNKVNELTDKRETDYSKHQNYNIALINDHISQDPKKEQSRSELAQLNHSKDSVKFDIELLSKNSEAE